MYMSRSTATGLETSPLLQLLACHIGEGRSTRLCTLSRCYCPANHSLPGHLQLGTCMPQWLDTNWHWAHTIYFSIQGVDARKACFQPPPTPLRQGRLDMLPFEVMGISLAALKPRLIGPRPLFLGGKIRVLMSGFRRHSKCAV
jgi:hypothetical protein